WPPRPAAALRLHHWTSTTDAAVRPPRGRVVPLPDGRAVAVLALAEPIATMAGASAVLRDPGSARAVAGVTVLDPRPPRGAARRRMTNERLAALATAGEPELAARLLDLHGARTDGGRLLLAGDVRSALAGAGAAFASSAETPSSGASAAALRTELLRTARRLVTLDRASEPATVAAIDGVIDDLVASGQLMRDGDRVRPAGSPEADAGTAAREAAMARLERALDVDVPPSLADAVRAAGCAPDAVVALERAGRIVRVEDDLAWTAPRYAALRERAVALARQGPLAPAAFRDAIGGNRRIVMPLLEDFDRKGFLRRTPAGHLPGPKA
ncbi:MAG TPA: SelB C-terminal domain-containing protein, partial [Candidatus Limnocylindrales bacterium]